MIFSKLSFYMDLPMFLGFLSPARNFPTLQAVCAALPWPTTPFSACFGWCLGGFLKWRYPKLSKLLLIIRGKTNGYQHFRKHPHEYYIIYIYITVKCGSKDWLIRWPIHGSCGLTFSFSSPSPKDDTPLHTSANVGRFFWGEKHHRIPWFIFDFTCLAL